MPRSSARTRHIFSFSNVLRSWLEIADEASPAETKRRLRDKLAALDEALLADLPALQSLLDLPVDNFEWSTLEPAMRRQRIMSSAKNVIFRGAAARPLLLWFEDIQWTDAETRILLDRLIENIEASSLLVVVTYRLDYKHKWPGHTEKFASIRSKQRTLTRLLARSWATSLATNRCAH